MASSYHRLDSWIPPKQEAAFSDDDPDATLGEDSVGDEAYDAEKGLHTTGVTRPPARMRTCYLLCRLSAVPVIMILLLIALLADPKPLTSKLPSRVQPYVDQISDRLRPKVEGGAWSDALYDMASPSCPRLADAESGNLTRPYDGEPMPRTALAAYPGSGDGYARELVERATGFRTSSTYCHEKLNSTFLGECDRGNSSYWLKQTHYPGLVGRVPAEEEKEMDWDRALLIVRNPLDAVFSAWHDGRGDGPFGNETFNLGEEYHERAELVRLASLWTEFHSLWNDVPIPKMTVRHEDLRSAPLPSLLRMVRYLVPPSSLPTLSRIACALTVDPKREVDVSARTEAFDSWPRWNEGARRKVLEMTTEGWCRYGYERDFRRRLDGIPSGIDCRAVAVERMHAHVDPEGSLWRRSSA